MRRLKPVTLNVKNIGRDGKKTTVSIPLKVDFGRQLEKNTQEINKEIDNPEEQDVPLHDLGNQPSTSQQQNRVLSTSGNWEKVREKLLNAYIEEQQPWPRQCDLCKLPTRYTGVSIKAGYRTPSPPVEPLTAICFDFIDENRNNKQIQQQRRPMRLFKCHKTACFLMHSTLEIGGISELLDFQFFWGSMPSDPPG